MSLNAKNKMIHGCTGLLVSFETFIMKIIHYIYFIGKNLLDNFSEDKDHGNGNSIDKRTVTTTDGQESRKPCTL